MSSFEPLIQQYMSIWNETDKEVRLKQIEKTWNETANYVDPFVESKGHEAINAMISGVQTQFPEHTFTLTGAVDGYQNNVRFSWDLVTPKGTILAQGSDFAMIAEDGRIQTVTGFIDKMPV